jgi:hypothetical protein
MTHSQVLQLCIIQWLVTGRNPLVDKGPVEVQKKLLSWYDPFYGVVDQHTYVVKIILMNMYVENNSGGN